MKNNNKEVMVGSWKISPGTCTLEKGGDSVKITPRNMDVLNFLVENAGDVVSSDQLLDRFWAVSTSSDHAVHKAIAELRAALGDKAQSPRYIKTISKRGYTLIAPVASVSSDAPIPSSSDPTPDHESSPAPAGPLLATNELARRMLNRPAALLVSLAGIVLLTFASWSGQNRLASEDRITRLAVLPFVNTAVDQHDQFIVNGLTDALLNGLSTLNGLAVLSADRATVAKVGSSAVELGQALGAEHLLQGTIQTAEGQLRVIVKLIRAADGVHLYAEQFDMPIGEIFAIQDHIASNVVQALSIHLDDKERSQMLDWGTTNALAYHEFLKGEFHYNQFSLADFERAIDHHLAAIELDPAFLNAYQGAATAANNLAVYSKMEKIRELDRLVAKLYPEVARIAPDSEVAKSIREIRLRMSGNNQVQQEIQLREQILAGDAPDFAIAHYALFLIGARLYDEALQYLALVESAAPFEISPDEVWSYRNLVKPPRSIVMSAKKQLQDRPNHIGYLGRLATNLALMGDHDQAQWYLDRQREVDSQGILSHHSEIIVAFLSGALDDNAAAVNALVKEEQDFFFNNGVMSFVLGDVENGMKFWRGLAPVQMRRLFNVVHSSEKFFPEAVLFDPRYQALLEELGTGKSWQRRLMKGVLEMESVTGVTLSPQARKVYDEGVFMVRNDLWTEVDWQQLRQAIER
ncbi:hypothetical protein F6455_02360 [Proteobacteria bacterium 005FR1]|nr:hypothetical protein [Proteobacteria bacterium 005FR1]